MANIITNPTFYPRRLSQYVPAMAYASDVNMSGDTRISFGAPGVALATYYLSGQSINVAGTVQASSLLNSATSDAPWGRSLTLVASGAATGNVIVDGYDYLNQPMSETLALNGATPVNGNKAFASIRQVTYPTVSATTINLGTGAKLGLPYKVGRVLTEELSSVPVASVGTVANPGLTSPANATSNDPRGLYTPTSTLTGSAVLTATFEFMSDVDASNVGGLMGVPHFSN